MYNVHCSIFIETYNFDLVKKIFFVSENCIVSETQGEILLTETSMISAFDISLICLHCYHFTRYFHFQALVKLF